MPSGNDFSVFQSVSMNRSLNREYNLFCRVGTLTIKSWVFEVQLFQESVNFDFRNVHEEYSHEKYKLEHLIKINKGRAKAGKE